MEIYNYTVYENFISQSRKVWLDHHCLDIVPEFEEVERCLEENDMLSYGMFIDGRSVGRLLFPWMNGWRYEGDFFDQQAIREIGRRIYFWIGLWE
jgi:hypothetical protein